MSVNHISVTPQVTMMEHPQEPQERCSVPAVRHPEDLNASVRLLRATKIRLVTGRDYPHMVTTLDEFMCEPADVLLHPSDGGWIS